MTNILLLLIGTVLTRDLTRDKLPNKYNFEDLSLDESHRLLRQKRYAAQQFTSTKSKYRSAYTLALLMRRIPSYKRMDRGSRQGLNLRLRVSFGLRSTFMRPELINF